MKFLTAFIDGLLVRFTADPSGKPGGGHQVTLVAEATDTGPLTQPAARRPIAAHAQLTVRACVRRSPLLQSACPFLRGMPPQKGLPVEVLPTARFASGLHPALGLKNRAFSTIPGPASGQIPQFGGQITQRFSHKRNKTPAGRRLARELRGRSVPLGEPSPRAGRNPSRSTLHALHEGEATIAGYIATCNDSPS